MPHATAHKHPLRFILSRLVRMPRRQADRTWRDSRPDTVCRPGEAPRTDHPDWIGFTPEIQRLLR